MIPSNVENACRTVPDAGGAAPEDTVTTDGGREAADCAVDGEGARGAVKPSPASSRRFLHRVARSREW